MPANPFPYIFHFVSLSSKCNETRMEKTKWSENVILIDCDYADEVTRNLKVNYSRMLNRSIPQADLAQWLVCLSLDGGLTPGSNSIQVILVHSKDKRRLENFIPSDYEKDIDGKAFSDSAMGEYILSALRIENLVSAEDFLFQAAETLVDAKEVKRLIFVADTAKYGERFKNLWNKVEDKAVTWLAMQPLSGKGFHSEILGYSLTNALGIRADEFK